MIGNSTEYPIKMEKTQNKIEDDSIKNKEYSDFLVTEKKTGELAEVLKEKPIPTEPISFKAKTIKGKRKLTMQTEDGETHKKTKSNELIERPPPLPMKRLFDDNNKYSAHMKA